MLSWGRRWSSREARVHRGGRGVEIPTAETAERVDDLLQFGRLCW